MVFGSLSEVAIAENGQVGGSPVSDYEILATYPHDPKAFTQGFCFADGLLYEGTGLKGQSALRRMRLGWVDMVIRPLPKQFFGEGIALVGNRIVQLTWKSRLGLVWDKTTMQIIGTFSYPTEGWGITFDGQNLIMSDGSQVLYFLDPESFQFKKKIAVHDLQGPILRLNELEYIRDEIWANIWKDSRIARINPETGRVTGWLDFTELVAANAPAGEDNVLNGIAYDKEKDRIFVTGKRWGKIFEIRLKE